jgi:hypothetical protein
MSQRGAAVILVTPAHAGERELEVLLRMELEYQDRARL